MAAFEFLKHRWSNGGRSILLALALTASAALLQTVFTPVVRPFPLLFYFPAIVLAAIYGDTLAGLVAMVACGVCVYHFAWPGPVHLRAAAAVLPFVCCAAVSTSLVLAVRAVRGASGRLRQTQAEMTARLFFEKQRVQSLQRRTATNMQAVASLLSLQKMKLRADPASAARVLDDARQRVVDMSRINRRLDERDIARGSIAKYLQSLCADFQSAASAHEIVCTASDDIDIHDPEKLMALSVLVGEAVGNAIKHAFADNQIGIVTVNLRRTSPTRCQLIVKDNGRGLAAHVDPSASGTSGFLIMQAMAVQLGGKLEVLPSSQGITLIAHLGF